ncbi:hypothetical protein BDK51DRAFT_27277 [Blyttiomyces helicus]|uniref:DNA mismatch repair protein MutS connector domain-containing protein n=1 Tax=Blyttiomyces helicus TaxID=388810 RepID=A0A4P9W754_9FUNG|nr:hypothetical protein BDK51DRAFT_27277 [Blyttiomyces helicus]|eukprot:RKO87882.1 hypothetical protein BDK51DRAFT_27277 [Blyttiomyces helicus]
MPNSSLGQTAASTRRPSTSASRPGTSASARNSTHAARGVAREGSFVVAVVEGRGVASEIGLAAINCGTAQCQLYQFADSQTYVKTLHKISLLDPVEILMPITAVEPTRSKLCHIIEEAFPDTDLVPAQRKYFNDEAGLTFIANYCLEEGMFPKNA